MMMTPWYPAHTRPVRRGMYLIKSVFLDVKPFMYYWNGKKWTRYPEFDSELAFQNREWRGVTK